MSAADSDLNVQRSTFGVERSGPAGPRSASTAVDAANPWPGLASFTEETRAYFFGREEEVAELGRRVQRKLLTILFGQSGLGKTSILRAGIVPRLRPEGYCPVYVRLDYSRESPPPAEQIKAAIVRASEAGNWTRAGVAAPGESLWEFLHHRDDVLVASGTDAWPAAGKTSAPPRTLTPLLIFDQFEEIFTLAQSDDSGRERAQAFLRELADLVENRPPVALEACIERDETLAEKFDFARADYRILIALREDYLAHLEGMKNLMPSVTQNRLRLARMTGAQAIQAVVRPGGALVTEEIAHAIVRFVSGARDLAHAEVEPSLLSLVCRELNEARLARGEAAISADLLAGSRETILAEFYARALADQPAGVRHFIEDALLTDSGYRESIAEERVRKTFAALGAPPETLATLVDRRLLRIEERLDVRRVELTHDVLCGVVKSSRDTRREREAKEAAEAQLAATRAHDRATQLALWRARLIATICAAVALAAIGSAIFGYVSWRRAILAEKQATAAAAEAAASRQLAENGRAEAEKLITFLDDDLWRDLQPFGHLDIARKLAQNVVDYYKQMPAALRTPATERNRALALANLGAVLNSQNNLAEAAPVIEEAVQILDGLHAAGDHSVDTISGLSLALISRSALFDFQGGQGQAALSDRERAVELLRPIATAPDASAKLLQDFSNSLMILGMKGGGRHSAALLEGKEMASRWLARDPSSTKAAYSLGTLLTRLAQAANAKGEPDQAEKLSAEASGLFDRVLAQEPANASAINFRGIARFSLSGAHWTLGRLQDAIATGRLADEDFEKSASLDPTFSVLWANAVNVRTRVADDLRQLGRIDESANELRTALALESRTTVAGIFAANLAGAADRLADLEARRGRASAAEEAIRQFDRLSKATVQDSPANSLVRQLAPEDVASHRREAWLALGGHDAEVFVQAREAVPRIEAFDGTGNATKKNGLVDAARQQIFTAGLRLGHYADAERAARELAATRGSDQTNAATIRGRNATVRARLEQALALVHLGRQPEALLLAEPALADLRAFAALQRESIEAKQGLAFALYVNALAQLATGDDARRARLDEAQKLLDEIPAEAKQLSDDRELAGWIAQERAK